MNVYTYIELPYTYTPCTHLMPSFYYVLSINKLVPVEHQDLQQKFVPPTATDHVEQALNSLAIHITDIVPITSTAYVHICSITVLQCCLNYYQYRSMIQELLMCQCHIYHFSIFAECQPCSSSATHLSPFHCVQHHVLLLSVGPIG